MYSFVGTVKELKKRICECGDMRERQVWQAIDYANDKVYDAGNDYRCEGCECCWIEMGNGKLMAVGD